MPTSAPAEKPRANKTYVAGILLLNLGLMFSNYGSAICYPTQLATYPDGMSFYALCGALATVGMMLSLPMSGQLGNMFGSRNVTTVGIAVQAAGRVGMVVAPNVYVYLVMVCLQGLGSGFFMSAAYAYMAGAVPASERARYYGLITAAGAVGTLTGSLATGVVIDQISPTVGLMMYLPIVLIAYALIFSQAPNERRDAGAAYDFLGVVLLVVAVLCLVLWLSLGGSLVPWGTPLNLVLLAVGLAAGFLLVRRETTVANPSVPIKMFGRRRFTASFVGQLCAGCYSTAVSSYSVLYIRNVLEGGSATLSGTATTPQTVVIFVLGIVLGGHISKAFVRRFRPWAIVGFLCATVATVILYLLTPTSPMLQIWAATGVGGVCASVAQSTFTAFFQTELKPSEFAEAQAMYTVAGTGGAVVFGAVAAIILNAGMSTNEVFLAATAFCVIGLVNALLNFRFTPEEVAEAEARADQATE